MKTIVTLLILLSINICTIDAQKLDNIWIFGYTIEDPKWYEGSVYLNFSHTPVIPEKKVRNRYMSSHRMNGSMCDEDGRLLFYTSGQLIFDSTDQIMDGLGPGRTLYNLTTINFLDCCQNMILLPRPGFRRQYLLLHEDGFEQYFYPGTSPLYNDPIAYDCSSTLYSSNIDMEGNEGLGTVVVRKQAGIQDTFDYGKITATRHANGRDWWIMMGRPEKSEINKYLITPSGFESKGLQYFQDTISAGLGTAVFSPDGTKYIRITRKFSPFKQFFPESSWASQLGVDPGFPTKFPGIVEIFDFDRCTGELTNHKSIIFSDTVYSVSGAVSHDSRFLYVSNGFRVFQFDLNQNDIAGTKKIIGTYNSRNPNSRISYEHIKYAQLGPDNRIYLKAEHDEISLHGILYPDKEGSACSYTQDIVRLPTYNILPLPNNPNYRLGALKGSPCDTLLSSVKESAQQLSLRIFPNPPTSTLSIELDEPLEQAAELTIVNQLGQQLLRQPFPRGQQRVQLDVVHIPPGLYFLHLIQEGRTLAVEKVVVVR